MSRPSRTEEAKAAIGAYYAAHGVMPTIEGVAKAMGYRSTSSAHNTVMSLVKEGFLTQDKRGGRLLPGLSFDRTGARPLTPAITSSIPPEIAASLPQDVQLKVIEVPNDSLKEHAIRAGDMLVLVDLDMTGLSDLFVLSRGDTLAISSNRKSGWRAIGLLIAQYRRYGAAVPS